jgi:hypothetical protein
VEVSSDQFFKQNQTDSVWWIDTSEADGLFLFSFDKKKIYNLFSDYPFKLTKEEQTIFDKENPYWKDFFSDRQSE